ncbi:hypothetical protein [Myxosarcina sp. GI1]|uniref:hypothetical protein n=1 Tax=Myxosarcina sp. GI1 TaxID=1541065 RepID=UPI00068DF107|nr:hypothetical protein [Myxosarcina sp. GI1]
MFFDFKSQEALTLSPRQQIIVQIKQPSERSQRDPLIDYSAEHLIDFGVVLLAVTVILIIGMLSKQMEIAILFALALSTCLIIVLWSI